MSSYRNDNNPYTLRSRSHHNCRLFICLFVYLLYFYANFYNFNIIVSPEISSNQITTSSANQFASGNQFRIPFEITGSPEPTFVLLQLAENGLQFVVNGPANGNVFSWVGNDLVITVPIPNLSGFYRVLASNQFGTQEFDFELEFTGLFISILNDKQQQQSFMEPSFYSSR